MSTYRVEKWQPTNPNSHVNSKVYAIKINERLVHYYRHIMIPGSLYSSVWCPESYIGYDAWFDIKTTLVEANDEDDAKIIGERQIIAGLSQQNILEAKSKMMRKLKHKKM